MTCQAVNRASSSKAGERRSGRRRAARLPLDGNPFAGTGPTLNVGVADPRLDVIAKPLRNATRFVCERGQESWMLSKQAAHDGMARFAAKSALLAHQLQEWAAT